MASRAAIWSLAVLWVACAQTGQAEDPVEVSEVQRAVPEDHTVSTVAIQVGKSRGSGFFLNFDGDIHFVTAKHVAFDKRKPGQLYDSKMQLRYWSHPTRGSQLGSMTVDLDGAARAKGLQIHNDFDVLAVRIGSGPEGEPLRLAGYVSGKGAIITTNRQTLLPFGDVAIGNDVYIYGYPTAIGLKNVPQVDFSRPLLRRGAVAGINSALRTIILDVMVHGGNSGGPVWQVERGVGKTTFHIVGVVSQRVPLAQPRDIDNSGYGVAVPIDVVIELIEGAVQAGS